MTSGKRDRTTRAVWVRLGAAYAVSRGAFIAVALGTASAVPIDTPLSLVIATVTGLAGVALLLLALELQKRARWIAAPSLSITRYTLPLAAVLDAAIVLGCALMVSSVSAPRAIFPAAALITTASIALSTWALGGAARHLREPALPLAVGVGSVVVRVAGAFAAWAVAARVVPPEWRAAQAAECAGAVTVIALVALAARFGARWARHQITFRI
ncbi:MAG: hypothetical protein FWF90_01300 [Promicromonosporaceae bacterium]|nr:hypothetical protein [Promicromonosporaceae bacterium]